MLLESSTYFKVLHFAFFFFVSSDIIPTMLKIPVSDQIKATFSKNLRNYNLIIPFHHFCGLSSHFILIRIYFLAICTLFLCHAFKYHTKFLYHRFYSSLVFSPLLSALLWVLWSQNTYCVFVEVQDRAFKGFVFPERNKKIFYFA